MVLLDGVSVQDRDLLARLTQYFSGLDARIKEGQGWLIFNAGRERAARITRFVGERLAERRPFISYYVVPWRDFALNAYMLKVELNGASPPQSAERVKTEYDIAGRVTRDQFYQMRFTDVLVVSGVQPQHGHELEHLDAVLADRLTKRLPTFLITPRGPHQLPEDYERLGGRVAWDRLYQGMYGTSLIAL